MKHDFMSHDLHLPELTLRGMLLGALITLIFTASNVYLGLKVFDILVIHPGSHYLNGNFTFLQGF